MIRKFGVIENLKIVSVEATEGFISYFPRCQKISQVFNSDKVFEKIYPVIKNGFTICSNFWENFMSFDNKT